jgi:succinate-acetate transporter protein
MVSTCFGASST